jgi:hypothetical protein
MSNVDRASNSSLGMAMIARKNDPSTIQINLKGGRNYYAVHYRNDVYALFKTTDAFIGFFPKEVLTDPTTLKAFAPSTAYLDGYWTTERCLAMMNLMVSHESVPLLPEAPKRVY